MQYTIKDFLEVKAATNPSFNYSGEKIAFLSNETGTKQLYSISQDGTDFKRLTDFEDSISFAAFSPIDDLILFGKSQGGDENTQFYLLSISSGEISELTKNPRVKYNFGGWSRDGEYIAFSHNERNGKDFDVAIMNVISRETDRVYDKGGNCYPMGFSPKRNYLVIKKKESNLDSNLFLLNLKTRELQLITPHKESVYVGGPSWLPDESSLFAPSNQDRDYLGLRRYDLQGEKWEDVFTPDWDIKMATASFDGKFLATITNENGYDKLTLFELPTLNEISLPLLPKTSLVYSVSFSRDSKKLTLVVGDSRHTSDIWTYHIESQSYRQITFSSQGVPPEELVEPSLFYYPSFDKLQIPAFLYLPKKIESGKRIPVIINIHGGPEAQHTPSLALLIQYFIYQGYAVIAPNVRGSLGYGKKYLALDDIEKRPDSIKDLASLYDYIKKIPELDENKVALMGGSYGGYMVLAAMAFFPNLWAGGISIVGISNLATFLLNTAPYRRRLREAEYGSLENNRELLYTLSPINYSENIKAPLMLIHGANDPRVPLSEAEQIYKVLKDHGREVEMLIYPDEGHGLSKLRNRLEAYPKIVAFLERIFNKAEKLDSN